MLFSSQLLTRMRITTLCACMRLNFMKFLSRDIETPQDYQKYKLIWDFNQIIR